ncbi:MAG: DUF945 family protein [Bacteroidetes bacterium]|nr:DUF945 family protein [Bacteroidota bacterium]
MKKILLVLLLLIVAAVVALPYYFGMKAEKQYHNIIAKIKESGNITVKKENYERGIFNSTAKTSIELKQSSRQVTVNSTDYIVHGPLDFLEFKKGNFNFNTFIAKVDSKATIKIPVTTSTGEKKSIEIKSEGTTDIGFDGEAESRYVIPKYKIIKKKEDLVINWSGLELNFIYNHKTKELSSYFESKSLQITDPNTALIVSSITGKSNTSDINQNLQSLTGDFEMKIDSVKLDSVDAKMDLDNLKFSGFSKTDQGKLQMGFKLTGDEMVFNENKFTQLTYDISIRDIDSATWLKLQQTANTIKGNENKMEQGMQIMGILPELVKHSPVIEIKELSLKSDMGNLNASAKVKINGDKPELLQNILLIGNAIEAEASVIASKGLVEFYIDKAEAQSDQQNSLQIDKDKQSNSLDLEQDFIDNEMAEKLPKKEPELSNRSKLQELIDNDYITSDDKNFIFKATLKSGQVTVNGKPMALMPMLLQ